MASTQLVEKSCCSNLCALSGELLAWRCHTPCPITMPQTLDRRVGILYGSLALLPICSSTHK